jgi:ATP-dependent DNA helicase RecQ
LFDGTDVAQKALSAIYRTGQMFGGRHIVDVLRGEKTDAVARNRHEQLALFGIGRDRSADFWRGVLRQLVARGVLRVKSGDYASLELVQEAARPILRGETPVMLAEEAVAPEKVRAAKTGAKRGFTPVAAAPASPRNDSLFDALRAWRTDIAKTQAVPPYVIFHDTVLRDIAAVRPATRGELAEIKGVGASKLDRYATDVLGIVQRHHAS